MAALKEASKADTLRQTMEKDGLASKLSGMEDTVRWLGWEGWAVQLAHKAVGPS
jgi:hypothetical protein